MPISEYFKGKGRTVMDNMKDEYGDEKGKEVFYATATKRSKRKGGKRHSRKKGGKKS